MALTLAQLQKLAPSAPHSRVAACLDPLNAAAHAADISTELPRFEMWLAEGLKETEGLVYLAELWGPTPAQRRYDPPGKKAQELGNTAKGDGYKYRGQGFFQLTGKGNFHHYGQLVGLDLVAQPELAQRPECMFRIAAAYWNEHGCSALADAGDFASVTRAINGGLTGYRDRLLWLEKVRRVLGGGP